MSTLQTQKAENRSVRIPVQPISGAEPLMCWSNVQKRIKAMGGRAVFGWAVRHDLYNDMKQNHCVWEDQDGRLWDVTPVLEASQGPFVVVTWPEYTEFERDDAATFEERGLPTRYVPTHDNLHVATACQYMERADEFLRYGDLDRCRYWTERANREMKMAGLRVRWDTPASLAMNDVIKTMKPPIGDGRHGGA